MAIGKVIWQRRKIASTIVHIVAPIILGSTIELYSFTEIAIYVFCIVNNSNIFIFTNKIDSHANNKTTKFSIKNYINTIKSKKKT